MRVYKVFIAPKWHCFVKMGFSLFRISTNHVFLVILGCISAWCSLLFSFSWSYRSCQASNTRYFPLCWEICDWLTLFSSEFIYNINLFQHVFSYTSCILLIGFSRIVAEVQHIVKSFNFLECTFTIIKKTTGSQ